jgi:hypothetical protein
MVHQDSAVASDDAGVPQRETAVGVAPSPTKLSVVSEVVAVLPGESSAGN